MLSRLIRMRWPIPVLAVALVAGLAAIALATTGSNDSALVVYNGRSHYGSEQVFLDFEAETGIDVELRGGTAPELFERLRREGEDTPADLLVTTDLANLWRAEEAGLLRPVSSPELESNIPERLRDPPLPPPPAPPPHCRSRTGLIKKTLWSFMLLLILRLVIYYYYC